MTQLSRWTSFRALTVVLAGVLLLAACGGEGGAGHGGGHDAAGTATEYDQGFIDGMVPHHQAAIDMAKIALERAEHPELRALAGAIVADQEREIGQMKGYRKAWYGSDAIAPGMGGHQMAGMDVDLGQLAAAQPFDLAFIDAMIPHHQSALDMAREAQTKAGHQELKDLAARIITEQQREIDQMREWRARWYPGR